MGGPTGEFDHKEHFEQTLRRTRLVRILFWTAAALIVVFLVVLLIWMSLFSPVDDAFGAASHPGAAGVTSRSEAVCGVCMPVHWPVPVAFNGKTS